MKNSVLIFILLSMLLVRAGCDNGATYQLSGHVLEGDSGLSDVMIHITGGDTDRTVTTDASGKYTIKRLKNGEYAVTPEKHGYAFKPAGAVVTVRYNDATLSISSTRIDNLIANVAIVTVPGGAFRMGDIQGNGESDESPVHMVRISSFEMSIAEVTQELYSGVTGSNPSRYVRDNLPVERVTWQNAARFCNSLSIAAGFDPCYDESTWSCDFSKNGYRLPTEAEWEYACRAGSETEYHTGDGFLNLDRAGWYESNCSNTKAAGLKEPNAWGLYDMHGNVSEWCNDWYGETAYDVSPGIDPTGPETGETRVFRGGNWNNGAYYCRASYRNFGIATGWIAGLGFRLVRRP